MLIQNTLNRLLNFMNIIFPRKYSRRGFTFLEIIIAIIVIAILLTLGFVIYTKFIAKSEDSEALSNLGAIRTAELAKRDKTGTFVNAVDTQDVSEKLSPTNVEENIFRYKVINATKETFAAIAESIVLRVKAT